MRIPLKNLIEAADQAKALVADVDDLENEIRNAELREGLSKALPISKAVALKGRAQKLIDFTGSMILQLEVSFSVE